MKKTTIGIIATILIVFTIIFLLKGSENYKAVNAFEEEVQYYKSLSCGCCDLHSSYLSNKGNLKINKITQENESIKEKYGIPMNLRTCHTAIFGDYFVEGHVPLEAINKLLEEKPDIKGIALPGMPAGSPGMPGNKNTEWIIYGVNNDGTTYEFMKI